MGGTCHATANTNDINSVRVRDYNLPESTPYDNVIVHTSEMVTIAIKYSQLLSGRQSCAVISSDGLKAAARMQIPPCISMTELVPNRKHTLL
jgi:hypothetical protein